MGYFPTPRAFIERAVAFLDRSRRAVIHYHYLARDDERDAPPREHFIASQALASHEFDVVAVRHVKNFAPHVHHFVADVAIAPRCDASSSSSSS